MWFWDLIQSLVLIIAQTLAGYIKKFRKRNKTTNV